MTKQKCNKYNTYTVNINCKKQYVRCDEPECFSYARGTTYKCVAHGGGKRCIEPGCIVFAVDKSNKCKRHGGGKRCLNCFECCRWPKTNKIVSQIKLKNNLFLKLQAGS